MHHSVILWPIIIEFNTGAGKCSTAQRYVMIFLVTTESFGVKIQRRLSAMFK
jgi:hypothetical protein